MKNKNFAILVVEDDYNATESLKGYLQNLGYFKILLAKNSQEALKQCRDDNILLTFLDIGLVDSELDGIELGKQLNKLTDTAIVFTSSFTDSTTLDRSDEVDHQNYLPKPLREKDVAVAIKKALKDKMKPKVLVRTSHSQCAFMDQDDQIFIKRNDKFYQKVNVNDILYVTTHKGGVTVHTKSGPSPFTYTTLASFLSQFNHPDIIRIHKSHAVNKRQITAKSDSQVKLSDTTELTIGAQWRKSINKHFHLIKPKS